MSDQQDNDKVLDEYLKGDSEISRRYRVEACEQTPEHLKNTTQTAVEALMDAETNKAAFKIKKEWYVPLSIAAVLVISVSVTFNMSNEGHDLEQYTRDVLQRPAGRIKPLPEIKPYESYSYESAQEAGRDPFQSLQENVQQLVTEAYDTGLSKEMISELGSKNREELESFELDSLRMIGTLEDAGERWGLILDPNGTVHHVKTGNYMGRNLGRIVNIFADKIELIEIVKNSQGRRQERRARIVLTDDYDASELETRHK